jgi:hypothetical protein
VLTTQEKPKCKRLPRAISTLECLFFLQIAIKDRLYPYASCSLSVSDSSSYGFNTMYNAMSERQLNDKICSTALQYFPGVGICTRYIQTQGNGTIISHTRTYLLGRPRGVGNRRSLITCPAYLFFCIFSAGVYEAV